MAEENQNYSDQRNQTAEPTCNSVGLCGLPRAHAGICLHQPASSAVLWLPIATAPIDDGRDLVVLWGTRPAGDLGIVSYSNGKWLQHGVELFNVTHWMKTDERPPRIIPPIVGRRRPRGSK